MDKYKYLRTEHLSWVQLIESTKQDAVGHLYMKFIHTCTTRLSYRSSDTAVSCGATLHITGIRFWLRLSSMAKSRLNILQAYHLASSIGYKELGCPYQEIFDDHTPDQTPQLTLAINQDLQHYINKCWIL